MITKSITTTTIITRNSLAEVTWMREQEELIYRTLPAVIPESRFQIITDNIEIFLFVSLVFYLISMFILIRWLRNKHKVELQMESRKGSMASDHSETKSSQRVETDPEKKDKNSSTESSRVDELKETQDTNAQITPYVANAQLINPDQLGQKLSIKLERRTEIQQDPESKIITYTETETLVKQYQANEFAESQLKIRKEQLKHENNITGSQEVNGMRIFEERDLVTGQFIRFSQVLTDWSKHCENGKFKRMFEDPQLIGKGAQGCVYKAKKQLDQKLYAVKQLFFFILNEVNLYSHKIFRETDALAKLNHPNIIRYYTSWIEELDAQTLIKLKDLQEHVMQKQVVDPFSQVSNLSYLDQMVDFQGGEESVPQAVTPVNDSFHYSDYSSSVQSMMKRYHFHPNNQRTTYVLHIEMELCENNTLREFIDTKGFEINIWIQILHGVNYIHEQKFIHRDLKPSNIFITAKNEVKIGDLGLTTQCGTHEELIFIATDKTSNIGTPMYMAPEMHQKDYDSAVDIYALGVILFEMLHPIKTFHQRQKLVKELTEKGSLPNKLLMMHAEEAKMIRLMTHKDPAMRPSAHQLIKYFTLNQNK